MKRAGREANPGRAIEDSFFGEDPLQSFRRFALPTRSGPPETDPLHCRHLRGKGWSVVHPAVERPDSTEPFLCLKTLRSQGPDGRRVLPDTCTDERGCFEAADCSHESSS
ncbi:MAG TPA: hypothetical protein VFW15_08255 [Thermoanaerobaculia bacterium]|nr:hypothetical protein [Thermoanaerobaculia bacterium]